MKTQVHVEYCADAAYPEWDERTCYGASEAYPEFASQNSDIVLSHHNQVYEMVRNTLAALNLDREHFGTDRWNPFSEFISKGDTVLIKPNMVRHFNGAKGCGMDCLVTHPSIVRAVIDYVVLALGGSGRIILADAPVQSCDFDVLIKELKYDKIANVFLKQDVHIELMDLRCFASCDEDVEVMMGKDSAFHFQENMYTASGKFRVTNYLPEYMEKYHKGDKHSYSIAKALINTDVIINLPKPKTHRKAGITASLKNMVGCVARKECLPHHTKGSKAERGDEYLKRSFFKKLQTDLQEKIDKLTAEGKKRQGIYSAADIFLYKAARLFQADIYKEGSWYGNDTLWRTVCDLCRIAMYADKNGTMTSECKRKMFVLADMIVAGEGEGPLCPSPRSFGMLVGGAEQIAVDTVISALMGFSPERIPTIANAGFGTRYRLPRGDVEVSSNHSFFHGRNIQEIKDRMSPFVPTSGWMKWLLEEKAENTQ